MDRLLQGKAAVVVDDPSPDRLCLRLVTGNSSWWKAKKYRREAAAALLARRAAGWRLQAVAREGRSSARETRRFSVYQLTRAPR
ncbi:MAG: hypothetical protein AAGH45_06280 [Pseudomonadota bacterium]